MRDKVRDKDKVIQIRYWIEEEMKKYLPKVNHPENKRIVEACNYSFLNGGKRIRPMLMFGAYDLESRGEIPTDVLSVFMTAIECIHTYSLIHDDLPAMDDDDYRRGKLTCHRQYDEATAVLAGDFLLNYSHELMLQVIFDSLSEPKLDSQAIVRASKYISQNAGYLGMLGGQVADLAYENTKNLTKETLDYIHEHKTGALIRASLIAGGLLAGADEGDLIKFEKIGKALGLAFQIQDDILDCIGDESKLGKPIGSDDKNAKSTYVTYYGLEVSQNMVENLFGEIDSYLETFDSNQGMFLRQLINYIHLRDY